MSIAYDSFIHLFAGGIAGTSGAIATCPLEVVKTRQQSSVACYQAAYQQFENGTHQQSSAHSKSTQTPICNHSQPQQAHAKFSGSRFVIWRYLKHIVETEGSRALFKGLGPTLVGVAPSRAIYFSTYGTVKDLCNSSFNTPDTPFVHMTAAASAGFVSCTLTNPIWFIKTRLQLDQGTTYGTRQTLRSIGDIYKEVGFLGLYKGITASYFGISETIIHFVIYEFLKTKLEERILRDNQEEMYKEGAQNGGYHVMPSMLASAISKTCASIIAYPHEVARTRLRQTGSKYRSFFQTLSLVYREEGRAGVYRGLGTQLLRQIPNNAIMMVIYELIVKLLKSQKSGTNDSLS